MAIINVSKILNYQNQKFNKIYYLTLHYDKNYRMMKYQIYRKKTISPPMENVPSSPPNKFIVKSILCLIMIAK